MVNYAIDLCCCLLQITIIRQDLARSFLWKPSAAGAGVSILFLVLPLLPIIILISLSSVSSGPGTIRAPILLSDPSLKQISPLFCLSLVNGITQFALCACLFLLFPLAFASFRGFPFATVSVLFTLQVIDTVGLHFSIQKFSEAAH